MTLWLNGRSELPRAAWEVDDEIKLYARESGRTATVHYVPGGGWLARFSLRPDDVRLLAYKEGRLKDEPFEDVWFHVPKRGGRPGDFIALDINQMGAIGVREFLEKGNMWSGKGEYSSLVEADRASREKSREFKAKERESRIMAAVEKAADKRRQVHGIPYLGYEKKARP